MKIAWEGETISVQPRIRLTRSFDQRSHTYLGYALRVSGAVDGRPREFSIGIGKTVQGKHGFRAGDRVSGEAEPVADPRLEPVALYKVAKLKLRGRTTAPASTPPPWTGIPPTLETYRERGHRRLDVRTYEARCSTCIWGCRMPVEMIIAISGTRACASIALRRSATGRSRARCTARVRLARFQGGRE
jgi:hypothetical protein